MTLPRGTGRVGLVKATVVGASAWMTPDSRYRFVNPWGMDTSIRSRWIVQERDDDDWSALDDDFATLTEARESVDA